MARNKVAPHPLWRLRHNTARPDILAAEQPQPVEPLAVGQAKMCGVRQCSDPGPRIGAVWRLAALAATGDVADADGD
jgi:hypothetical protein